MTPFLDQMSTFFWWQLLAGLLHLVVAEWAHHPCPHLAAQLVRSTASRVAQQFDLRDLRTAGLQPKLVVMGKATASQDCVVQCW